MIEFLPNATEFSLRVLELENCPPRKFSVNVDKESRFRAFPGVYIVATLALALLAAKGQPMEWLAAGITVACGLAAWWKFKVRNTEP